MCFQSQYEIKNGAIKTALKQIGFQNNITIFNPIFFVDAGKCGCC
jgi:hypothetical protein